VPGFFHKWDKRGKYGDRGHGQPDIRNKKEWFIGTINKIVQPDSLQAKQIQPITEWAATQIDSVERMANQNMSTILDSVKNQLKPILTVEQQKHLDHFDANAKEKWRGRGKPKH
ncbi:MAG TPA: hypothetical protein PLS08_13545, partial [Chryseolinea sp.]|nr:hypothetical protein [Chryseolinea sp.]